MMRPTHYAPKKTKSPQRIAQLSGAKTYFTGKPCKNGHVVLRYAINGNCAACNRADCRKSYYRNKNSCRSAA